MLLMWGYVAIVRDRTRGVRDGSHRVFLSTLDLAVVASSAPDKLYKQFLAVAIGVAVLLLMCVLLRNLESCKRLRWLLLGGAALLLVANLALGTFGYGAKKLAGNRACQLPAVGAGQGGVHLDRGSVTGRII